MPNTPDGSVDHVAPHLRLHHGAQYLAQNLAPVHLGLGTAAVVDSLVVAWPSGQVDRLPNLATSRRIRVVEGVGLGAPTAGERLPSSSGLSLTVGPTPFRDRVTIRVSADGTEPVRLAVFDVLGRRVHTAEAAGDGVFEWAPTRAAGTYLVRVMQGASVRTAQVVAVGR